ncbi:MAG: trans-o-hydroxybenzylidenepyruvate hydratase-aldolase [Alphaproteobacteria bacterium]|jgi:trans-o-hydroxybenzylidenepyruvate hydratase-aldolase|nr:trans-o-hydroxybenzylidenepyruvate hydratase-aldolase [Alphaproteobacteria bacterium]
MRQKGARLTAADIQGAWAILPTPAKDNASDWRAEDTVDLDETARVVEELIKAGVDGLLSLGTFGECATLTWDEKRAFMATVVETARGRVPYFGGTSSLNTRETVRQTRAAYDIGVDGTMLGPPMWCYPDLATSLQFYRDVAESCPGIAICVYANPEAFKFDFPRPFWAQIIQVPQVVAAKIVGIATIETDLRLTKGQIRLMPVDGSYYAAARIAPEECTAFWSGGALCGPAVQLALRDTVAAAKKSGGWSAAKEISAAIAAASARLIPNGNFAEFSKYNIGLEKARMNAAGWVKAGPCRPPYHIVPENYLEGARESGKMLAKLHAQITAHNAARS